MRRSPELVPLSHHHHVALEHALRLSRATQEELDATVARFLAFMVGPGARHFRQEESILLPALPEDAAPAGERLRRDHERLVSGAEALGANPTTEAAHALGDLLSTHVRFEERELFPLLEQRLPADELERVGRRLAED